MVELNPYMNDILEAVNSLEKIMGNLSELKKDFKNAVDQGFNYLIGHGQQLWNTSSSINSELLKLDPNTTFVLQNGLPEEKKFVGMYKSNENVTRKKLRAIRSILNNLSILMDKDVFGNEARRSRAGYNAKKARGL